jgi:hypothetical protein
MHRLAGGPDLSDLTPRTPRGKQRTRIAAPEELKRLFAHASPAMRYCLICWAQMAMRFTESLIPTPQKYNKENQTLETTVKGRHTRLYPVPNELAKILQSLEPISADEMDTPFYSLLHKRHRPQMDLEKLKKICAGTGTRCATAQRSRMTYGVTTCGERRQQTFTESPGTCWPRNSF